MKQVYLPYFFLIHIFLGCKTQSETVSEKAHIETSQSIPSQGLKVQGRFSENTLYADSGIVRIEFFVKKVLSESSSIIRPVGTGDTLTVSMTQSRLEMIDKLTQSKSGVFELILQEHLQPGDRGIIYSLKDLHFSEGSR